MYSPMEKARIKAGSSKIPWGSRLAAYSSMVVSVAA